MGRARQRPQQEPTRRLHTAVPLADALDIPRIHGRLQAGRWRISVHRRLEPSEIPIPLLRRGTCPGHEAVVRPGIGARSVEPLGDDRCARDEIKLADPVDHLERVAVVQQESDAGIGRRQVTVSSRGGDAPPARGIGVRDLALQNGMSE